MVAPPPRRPTAWQLVAVAHATATSSLALPSGGRVSRVQLVPSQCSATAPALACPAASQSLAEEQKTPLRPELIALAGVGAGQGDQVLPFHRATSAAEPVLLKSVYWPTAVHDVAVVQETELSSPVSPRGGTVCSVQFVPSHNSPSGC